MEPIQNHRFFDKWKNLDLPHKLALLSLLLIVIAFPVAILLTLNPTNPFSRASLPVTPTGGNNPATISFVPSNLTVAPNENFSVAIQLNTGDYSATGADITINYNPAKVHATDVLEGPFLPSILENSSITEDGGEVSSVQGKVHFVVGSSTTNPKQGIGTIAVINFKALTTESTDTLTISQSSRVAAISTTDNVLSGGSPAQVIIQSPQATSLTLKLSFEGVNVQNNLTKPLPQKTVNVSLSNLVSDASASATISKNISFLPNTDGTYSGTVTGLTTGSYNLLVKGPVNLRKNVGKVVLTQGENLEDITYSPLTAGDVSGDDNNVDGYDYSLLVLHFGSRMPTTGSAADLNFDGTVDIFDHRLLVKNFGRIGD
jgi:hypothetical protein